MTLRAGIDPSTDFAVHEAILREHSPFFRTALDNKWREGRSRQINLPQDSSEVVAAYVHWLYFQEIASKPTSPPSLPIDDGEYQFLAMLYVFGEKVQADAFCDDILDAMASKTDDFADDGTRTFPSHAAIMTLYNGTPPQSPARRFAVEMYATFGTEHWIPEEADCNHAEFMTDLVRVFLSRSPSNSAHQQLNFSRRYEWHKQSGVEASRTEEFLRPADSVESIPALDFQ